MAHGGMSIDWGQHSWNQWIKTYPESSADEFFGLLVAIDAMTFSNHFFVVVMSQVWLLPFDPCVLLEKVGVAVDHLVSEVQLLRFFVQIQQQQLLGGDCR